MKKFTLRFVVLCFIAIGFYGCETANISPSGCELTEADANAYSAVAMKFNSNPTTANCSALKQASFNLIKKFENCSGATKDQVDQLTQMWVDIDCNAFN